MKTPYKKAEIKIHEIEGRLLFEDQATHPNTGIQDAKHLRFFDDEDNEYYETEQYTTTHKNLWDD